jgi:hypothetical protein
MKTHHIITATLSVVIIILGLILWTNSPPVVTDELTGTWYAGDTNEAGLSWWMQYTFDNGNYTLETGTDYSEEGTYIIKEEFLDGSKIIEKTFYNGEKIYEMAVRTDPEEPDALYVEGVRLERVEQ